MSQINITNLTFAYDGSYENIFENVSFRLDTTWRLGFTGRNGRGKTTFLNLLMGKYEYSGNIFANVNFEYFPFAVKNPKLNTIDIITSLCPKTQEWEILRELSLLEMEEDALSRPFETLSKGEETKVLLAALFLKPNNFLLIDEPTNHLDMHARQIVSQYLKNKDGFILVSHDIAFLDNCIDHILSINKVNIEIQKGNFSSWWENKERQDNFELAENEKLKKDIKRLSESAKKKATWADKVEKTKFNTISGGLKPDRGYIGHKSAKMMKRSKSIENRQYNAIKSKSKLLKNIENGDSLKISQLDFHTKQFVRLKDICIFYGNKTACQNVTFLIEAGERIALLGKNGSGKSSILKLILGEKIDYGGDLKLASGLKISYVSQDTAFLEGTLSQYAYDNQIEESMFKAILRKLDFSREQFEGPMENFSGGQKKKVLIAKSLCQKSHLHIWDEPLNFIDVMSRLQIESLILQHQPTLLFVEHDANFLNAVATKRVEL